MDFSMDIDRTSSRKRCRGEYSTDDCSDAYPTAKKTRQFHFPPSDADAFASAFALAQQVHLPFDNASSSCAMPDRSTASSPNNESASPSGSSTPGAESEDPLQMGNWGRQAHQLPMQGVQQQQYTQMQAQAQLHQQAQLHPSPGRRGMIISGWNQSRRNDALASVVTSWPQR